MPATCPYALPTSHLAEIAQSGAPGQMGCLEQEWPRLNAGKPASTLNRTKIKSIQVLSSILAMNTKFDEDIIKMRKFNSFNITALWHNKACLLKNTVLAPS